MTNRPRLGDFIQLDAGLNLLAAFLFLRSTTNSEEAERHFTLKYKLNMKNKQNNLENNSPWKTFWDAFMQRLKIKYDLHHLYRPIQCHLWKKENISNSDLHSSFKVLETFSEDSHLSHRLITCKDCGQLYLQEFYEEVDWEDGEDPQYVTYVPVKDRNQAIKIHRSGVLMSQIFRPSLKCDWPKGKDRSIYWVRG